MTSVLAPITAEDLNKRSVVQPAPKKESWKGTHLKFDDEGNSVQVVKDVELVEEKPVEVPEAKQESSDVVDAEETEQDTDEVADEPSEDNVDLWAYREPKKEAWSGKHIKFTYKEDEEEDDKPEAPQQTPDPAMEVVEQTFSKLTTQ